MKGNHVLIIVFILGLICSGVILLGLSKPEEAPEAILPPVDHNEPAEEIPAKTVILENLTVPWDIAFPEKNKILVTERIGQLVSFDMATKESKIIPIPEVNQSGEGGLLGLTLHPDFTSHPFIYLYITSKSDDGYLNRIERYKFTNEELTERALILGNIPGAPYHDGGRIDFGPDGYLYVSVGDASKGELAQDKNSLAGKILRIKDDGTIPADNPFGNAIWSWGHRNPQGFDWDEDGRMFATEHGRSGVLSGLDEINLITKGTNYGWPESEGDKVLPGTKGPIRHSGSDVTWAPASALYYKGSLFFGGLRGETLYQAVLEGDTVIELREHFKGEFGRIRTIRLGPDGMMYITTSNRDGRGEIKEGDDKVIRLNPDQFSS